MEIVIHRKLCLQSKFVKAKCTACSDICPTKAINENLEIEQNCTNCGLCLSHCPAEAIAGQCYTVKAIEKNITTANHSVKLICQKQQSDSIWPCLGFLDPTLLLAFIYSGKDFRREVIIYQEKCEACSSAVAWHLAWTIEETRRLLGNHQEMIINSQHKFSAEFMQSISRRCFFTELLGASVLTVREIAFPDTGELQPIPRRKLFLKHCSQGQMPSQADGQTVFKTLSIDNACNACGICAKVCGSGALSAAIDKEVLVFRHNSLLCINCGICAMQCAQRAITLHPATSLGNEEIERVNMPICPDCGNLFQPIGDAKVCLDCLQKNKIFSL